MTGSWDNTVKVWNADKGTDLLTLPGHTDGVRSAAFNHDGTRISSASGDQTVRVWDAGTGAELLTLKGHMNGVTSAAFSLDGTRIVTSSEDETVKRGRAAPEPRVPAAGTGPRAAREDTVGGNAMNHSPDFGHAPGGSILGRVLVRRLNSTC